MAEIQVIDKIDQLKKFLNKDGVLEIAIRGRNKRFSEFQKLAISNSPKEETSKLLQNAISAIKKNNAMTEKSISMLKNVTKLQQLNIVFGALNMCATCAGFAIMYAKLDKISSQINRVMGTVKEGQDIAANYEFHKVLSEHANMLDARKTQKYYTEEQMRQLVDDEYNVLNMLIEGFMKEHTVDIDNLIVSIYSMASMMTVSLRYFDELYYLNNNETIGDGDIWHSSHDNWTGVFKKLTLPEFVEKLQDYCVFDLGLSMFETDIYYQNLYDQVKEMEETIADNQQLIMELQSAENMMAFEEYINQDVANTIKDAFEKAEGVMDNAEVVEVYQKTMKQMGLYV